MPRRTDLGEGKKSPLNMRTTPQLREKIEKAAGESGRSLVQEVEYRLERSFDRQDLLTEILTLRFGSGMADMMVRFGDDETIREAVKKGGGEFVLINTDVGLRFMTKEAASKLPGWDDPVPP